MRLLILVLFGFASTVSLQAAELVEGVIYLKNGTRIEYTDLDRIALPKQNGTVRAYLHAFSKQKQKFTYQPSEIDSVVCWHPQAWEHPRRFYYAPSVGWCWVYFETPYIRVCVMRRKVTVSELTEAYSAGRDAARSAPPAWPIICKKKAGKHFCLSEASTGARKIFSANGSPSI